MFTEDPKQACWPFWVLELTPDAQNPDIEKAARDIQAKIQLGVESSFRFRTPAEYLERDEHLVREAKAALQNPERRLLAEFWYIPPCKATYHDGKTSLDTQTWLQKLGAP